MDTDDAALMYEGWGEEMLYQQQVARKVTMILADVVSKSMGGRGVMKNAKKIWPLPGDDKNKAVDLFSLLKKHNELGLETGVKKKKRKAPPLTGIKDPPLVKKTEKKNKNGKR